MHLILNDILNFFLPDITEFFPLIISGLTNTITLALIITSTGLIGGVIVLYFTISDQSWIRKASQIYISFFIGTPLLVILFLIYYGLPQYGIETSAFAIIVICFTLNVSAYNASYLMSAYRGLDYSEIEAARAQGFTNLQVYRLVTLPQVLRTSVPALTNQVINNLKDTSIVFLIGYTEFFARMQELASYNFRFFMVYTVAASVYILLAYVIVKTARHFEHSLNFAALGRFL